MEKETNPLRLRLFNSKDFPDGMYDTEQQPDDQGESSDKTAENDIECEHADRAGDPESAWDKPEAHFPNAEREAHA